MGQEPGICEAVVAEQKERRQARVNSLVDELREIIADPEMPITQDFLKRLLAALEAK